MRKEEYKIAYLSMEIALEDRLRSYAGGLGVLAGDILKSAADLSYKMVGITILSDKGYFDQEIIDGKQVSIPESDYDFSKLRKMDEVVSVNIGTEEIQIGAWEYLITGVGGSVVPVYFLDTNLESNHGANKHITSFLYGGNNDYRLKQEIVLGIGGVKLLDKLGYKLDKYHLNEGHNSLAAAYLSLQADGSSLAEKIDKNRNRIVFTNHTPIKAGNDSFSLPAMIKYLPEFSEILNLYSDNGVSVNMTKLGMSLAGFSSGVSKPHRKVLLEMFPGFKIGSVNNGVNTNYWASDYISNLFDNNINGWKEDNSLLIKAKKISLSDISLAHQSAKRDLISYVKNKVDIELSESAFTIGFARRFAPYKRSAMILSDMERLLSIHKETPIQIIYAGKAHPQDELGQKIIAEILQIAKDYENDIKIVFLEDYGISLSKLLVSGCDIWLNNPLPYLEASGTSGMKAAINGVPQLSTKDGWWVEGYKKGKTGWSFGKSISHSESGSQDEFIASTKADAPELYDLLAEVILPIFYHKPTKWQKIMRSTIAINGSRFSSQNTVKEYIRQAYSL